MIQNTAIQDCRNMIQNATIQDCGNMIQNAVIQDCGNVIWDPVLGMSLGSGILTYDLIPCMPFGKQRALTSEILSWPLFHMLCAG